MKTDLAKLLFSPAQSELHLGGKSDSPRSSSSNRNGSTLNIQRRQPSPGFNRSRIIALAVPLLFAGTSCESREGSLPHGISGAIPERQAVFDLEPDRFFGWEEITDALRGLTVEEEKAGGGVLSRPIGLAEGRDSSLFVLDADYQKVAVFSWDGGFQRVIIGGYGEGPGEFVSPYDIDLDESGRLFVFDGHNNRVTIFDESGLYSSSFNAKMTNTVGMKAEGGEVFIQRYFPPRTSDYFVQTFSEDGDPGWEFARATAQDADLQFHGARGSLGKGRSGEILFAYPAPSTWTTSNRPQERVGVAFHPDARGEQVSENGFNLVVTRVGVRGIAGLPDGRVVISWFSRPTREVPRSYHLDVMTSEGGYLGSYEFPDSILPGRMIPSRIGPYLYFTSHGGLIPGVWRFRLVPKAGGGR